MADSLQQTEGTPAAAAEAEAEERAAEQVRQDQYYAARLAKLERIEAAGIDPFPARYPRTHTLAEAVARFPELESYEVRVAGRIRQHRLMGRAAFMHLEDESGRLQVYLKQDILGADTYAFWNENLDLADFIGVRGPLFRTRTGEITVEAREVTLLAKALRPPPSHWHGLTDVETRLRQRYLDLMVNPEVRETFRIRAKIVSAMRRFLEGRGFLEVETPVLQPVFGGATARPFTTYYNALDRSMYLRIALELYLKRLVVGGFEKVYEIGRNFRNEGVSTKHNPEFTMLETYEAYADYHAVMRMVEELIAEVTTAVHGGRTFTYRGQAIDVTPPWRRTTLREAILEHSGVDYAQHPNAASLAEAARAAGLRFEGSPSRGKLIDELLSQFVEPRLMQPTFLTDYPVELSPLAKTRADDPATVERFEAFMGGLEIANAFSELNDPRDQRARFEAQLREREGGDEEAHLIDEDYVTALEHGLPPTGGLGVGIDRLTILLADQSSIREVVLFPQLRT